MLKCSKEVKNSTGFGETTLTLKKQKQKQNNNSKTKPEKAGLVFQKDSFKDSFKVAKQNESINAESQFTKREAKMGEAVSSGLTNSL